MGPDARRTAAVLVLLAAVAFPSGVSFAKEGSLRLDAVAVSLGGITSGSGTIPITIQIDRWSSDDERARLKDAVLEKGDDSLLQTLQSAKPVGTLSTAGTVGWDLHYAHEVTLSGGGRRIVFATDRPMSFAERARGTLSTSSARSVSGRTAKAKAPWCRART